MKKNLLIIIILFVIINCFSFKLFNSNKQNSEVIEKMSTSSNANTKIIEQINKIYKTDIQAIRNLSDMSTKLQKGKLVIPGNLTIKENLVTVKNANIGPINTNRFILAGKNISNEIIQLKSKISALQTRLANANNKHSTLLVGITTTNARVNNLKSNFINNDTLILGPNKIYSNNKGFQFGNNSKGPYANNMITCHAYVFGAFYKPFRLFRPMFDPIAKYNNHTIVK